MPRRALLVGIDGYDDPDVPNLSACVSDAMEMREVLSRNGDGSVNFDCRVLLGPGGPPLTRDLLRARWQELFADFKGDILFYFSGHGSPGDVGGYLVTQDGSPADPGLPMNELVDMANGSAADTVLIILDCCYSGAAGNEPSSAGIENQAILREGVTILAASRATQEAFAVDGQSVFTSLVLGALRGGAADVRGRISAASVYGYVEAILGAWDQRPVYKSHAGHLQPVRTTTAKVTDADLRKIVEFFPDANDHFALEPTYEITEPDHDLSKVAVFRMFKDYQVAGLLCPTVGQDLFWTAKRSGNVQLTALGEFYHELVTKDQI